MNTRAEPNTGKRKLKGAEIICEAPIARVRIKSGRATGVVLENGDEHNAKVVISSLDHARSRNYELAPESLGRTHAPWHLAGSKTTLHKIFHDPDHPSHLLLPVIPAAS